MSEPQHRFKMPAQHGRRNQFGHIGRFVAAVLNLVQRGIAQLLALGILFFASLLVPLRSARIEIPAVVVDALALLLQLFQNNARTSASVLPLKMRNPTTTSATCTPVLSM